MAKLHFVGFRDDDHLRVAVRYFGVPASVHPKATRTVMGAFAATDTVILGPHAFRVPDKWKGKPLVAHAPGLAG
jgi:hypothetical protein